MMRINLQLFSTDKNILEQLENKNVNKLVKELLLKEIYNNHSSQVIPQFPIPIGAEPVKKYTIRFNENNDKELIEFFNRMNNKYKHWMNSYIRYVLNEYVNKINQTK